MEKWIYYNAKQSKLASLSLSSLLTLSSSSTLIISSIMDAIPSPTLYINNINEKIKTNVLKKMFIMIFSQYGKVKGMYYYHHHGYSSN